MKTVPLISSNLQEASYDEDTQELEITFVSGTSYTYYSVPESVFEGLTSSSSPGRYFHQNIKGIYAAA